MQCLTRAEADQWRAAHSRRRNWKRQLTCVTPLKRLSWFANLVVNELGPIHQALLIVDQCVMSVPPSLEELRRDIGEIRPLIEAPGHVFDNQPEALTVTLQAIFSGWIDFRMLLVPSAHALRADHDEYTTFFSKSSGKLAKIRDVLLKEKIEMPDWTAPWP